MTTEKGQRISLVVAGVLFSLSLALYISHMAPSVVPGDPGEYQLIAARWGIGHPPGYGFYALVGNLFTHMLPFGSFAWRANLLSAVCGAAIVALAYGIGRTLDWAAAPRTNSAALAAVLRAQGPSVFGALVLATGLDLWQHALHANAHILTALLATIGLFFLVRWWRTGRDRWLLFCCLIAGLSPVQHPLLVFAFPAYAAFVLAVRPGILRRPRMLLAMTGMVALGSMAFLYYPIRASVDALPLFPPSDTQGDMNTWAGFVRVVTAQGLRVNLGGFTAADVLRRLWDVRVPLGLQYTTPVLVLSAVGLGTLWARHWRPALLLSLYLAGVVFVTVNVLQDAMAYLLGPTVVVGVLAGVGAATGAGWLARSKDSSPWWRREWVWAGVLMLLPLWSLVGNWSSMDLRDFRDADEWLQQVERRFVGQEEHAALLIEWERATTVFYYAAVEGRRWDAADLEFVYIPAGGEAPFRDAVDVHLAEGPVYLTAYRPEVAAGYRLLPSGGLWQALPAWPQTLPAEAEPVQVRAEGRFEIVGWHLDQTQAQPGDTLLLDLYMRLPHAEGAAAQQYYMPWAALGGVPYRFTSDGRFLTPWWQPGEIVVERFELPVPWQMEAGRHPLEVGVEWRNAGRDLVLDDGATLAPLTGIEVEPAVGAKQVLCPWLPQSGELERALGNLGGDILLRRAWVNGRRAAGVEESIPIRPGQRLRVVLEWMSLRPIDENYKVFVQVLGPIPGLELRAQGDDKAPLRGSAPTLLWFPRWRRGTRIADTYELQVPADLPPGQYALVTGMYGFTSFRRVPAVRASGGTEGDWITLTNLVVK